MEWYEITLLILLVIALIGFLIFVGFKSNQNKEKENEIRRQEAGKEGEDIINSLNKEEYNKLLLKIENNPEIGEILGLEIIEE